MTTTEATMTDPTTTLDAERADLQAELAQQRYFLLHTAEGLTDEQATATPTASELCLGGIIKHVAHTEAGWLDFIEKGTSAMEPTEDSWQAQADSFRLLEGETLDGVRAYYAEVAARSDALLASLPDLNVSHALPEAPWFPPGTRHSARRVFIHILAETAHHTGHADIIRETIDGQKSMG